MCILSQFIQQVNIIVQTHQHRQMLKHIVKEKSFTIHSVEKQLDEMSFMISNQFTYQVKYVHQDPHVFQAHENVTNTQFQMTTSPLPF